MKTKEVKLTRKQETIASEDRKLLVPMFVSTDYDKPTDTVYAYVPSSVIIDVIENHGGMVSGELPGLDLTDYDEEE